MRVFDDFDYKADNPSWARASSLDELFRLLPKYLTKWHVLKYHIVNKDNIVDRPTVLTKYEEDIVDKLLKKCFTKEEALGLIEVNDDFIRATKYGVLKIFVDNYGLTDIIEVFAKRINKLEVEKNNAEKTRFITKKINDQKFDLMRIVKFLDKKEDVELFISIVSPEFIIQHYDERLENFPCNIRSFFTDLDYKGNKANNIRLASVKHWKDAKVRADALNLIPTEEMGEAIDYYLKNNVELAKALMNSVTKVIFEKYISVNYSYYPLESQELIKAYLARQERQIGAIKQASEKRRKMLEKERRIREKEELKNASKVQAKPFFKLANGEVIVTQEDCLLIAQSFILSKLSIEKFCKKYKIVDTVGFRKMLDKVSEENEEYKDVINESILSSQQKFVASTHEFINSVLQPNADIEELVKNNKSKQRDLKTILAFNLPNSEKELIIYKITRYFSSKLKMDDKSSSRENIDNMLTENDIIFMIGKDNFDLLKSGASIDIFECFRELVAPYRLAIDQQTSNTYSTQQLMPIKNLVDRYQSKFISKKYLATEPGIGDKYGQVVKVTPEMVDMAMHYAKTHKLYTSNYTMDKILKAIVDKEIDNQEEMLEAKQRMQYGILQALKECTTVEEYLKTVEDSKDR